MKKSKTKLKLKVKKNSWQTNTPLISLMIVGVLVLAIFIGKRFVASQSVDINLIAEVTPALANCGVRDFVISSFCDNGKIKQSGYVCVGDDSANSGHNIDGNCLSYDEAYKVAVAACANTCNASPTLTETSGPVTRICKNSGDCPTGHTCYQPPMSRCPKGQACAQVMPPKYCTSKIQAK